MTKLNERIARLEARARPAPPLSVLDAREHLLATMEQVTGLSRDELAQRQPPGGPSPTAVREVLELLRARAWGEPWTAAFP